MASRLRKHLPFRAPHRDSSADTLSTWSNTRDSLGLAVLLELEHVEQYRSEKVLGDWHPSSEDLVTKNPKSLCTPFAPEIPNQTAKSNMNP